MQKNIYNEQTGISYTLQGDYYLPDLTLPAQKKKSKSAYGGSGICGISVSIKRHFIPAF